MAEAYSLELAARVVCQLAESSGFDGIQRSALDTLADLLVRYIAQAARGAAGCAELAGRTRVNAIDMVCMTQAVQRARFVTPDTP